MAVVWFYDPETGDLYYPDETQADNIGTDADIPRDAQLWAIGIVEDIGLANLTDDQMMWLLSMIAGIINKGPPVSEQ